MKYVASTSSKLELSVLKAEGGGPRLRLLLARSGSISASAVMLQGSSPVATLVDFMSIGAGTLAGAITEQDVLDRTGQLTLTGFAAHACRVESVIRDLRANISAEQLQNFELVSKVVDEVLTPLQTCVICAKWGSGCPDMIAVTRAITVQTMELMPELR